MAAKRKYRWEEWFGKPRTVLVRGVDYHCAQAIMWQQVRNNAGMRGVKIHLRDEGDRIVIEMRRAGGGATKYPWDDWFSGDLLLLEKSTDGEKKDFDVDVDFMPPIIKTAARRRYKVCQISRYDADGKRLVDSLIIRARDMTADERAAEDLRRAEEKAARAAGGKGNIVDSQRRTTGCS